MMHTPETRRHTWHVCSLKLCLWPHIHNRETAVRVEQFLQLHAHENSQHTRRKICCSAEHVYRSETSAVHELHRPSALISEHGDVNHHGRCQALPRI